MKFEIIARRVYCTIGLVTYNDGNKELVAKKVGEDQWFYTKTGDYIGDTLADGIECALRINLALEALNEINYSM